MVSTDCLEDMVAQARTRSASVSNMRCSVADLTDLSAFADQSVDVVTACYGLMFLG